jgi:hypothetical protein
MAHAAALLVYGVLTVALTWPLATQLGSLVPHDLGDPLLSTWTLWWNAHVVPFTDRWWDGLAFFPARRTLTLSDHRVGLGLITSPLIWLGVSPLAAHNVSFLATFVLSAAAAYALCFTLTRSASASFIGGLVFGFNPFRAEHLPHLELLASYWLPVVLLSLHQWIRIRRIRWAVMLALALTLQAVTCGYYFVFSGVLIGLWLLWFMPRIAPLRDFIVTAVALIVPLVVIAPVLLAYRDAHAEMGLARSILEIEEYSADVVGLITAPDLLAFWNTPTAWQRPEGAILPGATAVLLTAIAIIRSRTLAGGDGRSRRLSALRTTLLAGAVVMIGVALVPSIFGAVDFQVVGLRISISSAFKPFSVAMVFFGIWLATTRRVRDAWRAQSPFAFYVLATMAMWVFALGPTARLLGHRVFYKAPYSWLMLLPGFRDEFRAPARFAMLAALTLSVAAAIAFCRFFQPQSARVRWASAAVLGVAIMLESWVSPFPVIPAPSPLEIPAAVPDDAVIAELPMGIFEDATAMYHSMSHLRPTVNGMSGYDPPHHAALRAALMDGAVDSLTAVAARDIAIFVRRDQTGETLASQLTSLTTAQSVAVTATHEVFLLRKSPADRASAPTAIEPALPIHGLAATTNAALLPHILDDDRVTVWISGKAQNGSESITADLGAEGSVRAVVLEMGGYTSAFPRAVAIELSPDGHAWQEVWRGATSARSVAAAFAHPRQVPLVLDFTPRSARYVRIKQVGVSQEPWVIARLTIVGQAAARLPL